MKTSELTGDALDWAVTYAQYGEAAHYIFKHNPGFHRYSADWAQGGPIIEREKICPCPCSTAAGSPWSATDLSGHVTQFGPTPLVAAMRCYVASKLGDEVEVPDGLL